MLAGNGSLHFPALPALTHNSPVDGRLEKVVVPDEFVV
jgi:hypothetical protein